MVPFCSHNADWHFPGNGISRILVTNCSRQTFIWRDGGCLHVDTVHSLNSSMTRVQESSAQRWPDAEFKQVFLDNYSRIVAVLMRLLGDRMRAEEMANDAFLKLYQQPGLREGKANISGWLYRTATNLGIDGLRSWRAGGDTKKRPAAIASGIVRLKVRWKT